MSTRREQVMSLLNSGLTIKEVANELNISEKNVSSCKCLALKASNGGVAITGARTSSSSSIKVKDTALVIEPEAVSYKTLCGKTVKCIEEARILNAEYQLKEAMSDLAVAEPATVYEIATKIAKLSSYIKDNK